MLPCTTLDVKPVCTPPEVDPQRKINLDYSPQFLETLQTLDKLCGGYKDILSLHQGDICHTKLLTMDFDTSSYCTETLYILYLLSNTLTGSEMS